MARRCIAVLLALASGCLDGAHGDLPEAGQTRLLVHLDEAGAPRGRVLGESPPLLALPSPGTWLVGFDLPPQALLLEPGPLPELEPDDPAQDLPRPEAAYTLVEGGWSEADPDMLPELPRIPRVDFVRCHALGGCLSLHEPTRCDLECAPRPPAPPTLPSRPCPEGWLADRTTGGPALCRPPMLDPLSCPQGSRHPLGEPDCRPLGPCAAGWATPRPEATAVLHVRPGEAGDGSMQAPFGTIADALAVAPAGADILLSANRHLGAAAVQTADLRIAGVCAERTAWVADAVLLDVQAPLTVEGVRLRSLTSTAVVIREQSDLHLRAAHVDGEPAGVDAQGDLRAQEVRIEGSSAIEARAASVSLEGAELRGQLALWDGARLEAEELRMTRQGIVAEGAEALLVRNARIENPDTGVAATGVARVVLEDLAVLGELKRKGIDLETAAPPAVTSSITLRRVAVFGAREFGLRLAGGGVDARDVYVRSNARSFTVYITEEPYVPDPPPMRFDGLWVEGAVDQLLSLIRPRDVPPGLRVIVNDMVGRTAPVDDLGAAFGAVTVSRDLRLELRRAYIEAHSREALNINCGSALLEDVTIGGTADIGVLLEAAVFGGDERLMIDARRMQVRAGAGRGFLVEGSDSCPRLPSRAEDIDVVGCATCALGLGVVGEARLHLFRARARGFRTGLEIGDLSELRLEEGHLEVNTVGVHLPAAYDPTDTLRAVRFEANREAVSRR